MTGSSPPVGRPGSLHVALADSLSRDERAGASGLVDDFGRMLAEGLHPGAQLAVVRRGELLLEIAGGSTEPGGAPVVADTLFQMRSITKLLAVLVTLRCLERGRFALDDTVASYWPGFAQAGKASITVRHVMSHRAGIPDGPMLAPAALHDAARVRAAIEAMSPAWPPGTASGYHAHTIGWVLQDLVRIWEGRSLDSLLRAEILEPLGIRDVHLGLPASEYPRMARMTVEDSVRASMQRRAAMSDFINSPEGVALPLSSVMGVATARDLARLMSVLAQGGAVAGYRVLRADTLAQAAVPTNEPGVADLRLGHPIRWGLGFILGSTPDIYGSVQRPHLIGHAGGGSNVAWADTQQGLGVAFLCNRMIGREASWVRCRRVGDAVYAAFGGANA